MFVWLANLSYVGVVIVRPRCHGLNTHQSNQNTQLFKIRILIEKRNYIIYYNGGSKKLGISLQNAIQWFLPSLIEAK